MTRIKTCAEYFDLAPGIQVRCERLAGHPAGQHGVGFLYANAAGQPEVQA